MDENIIKRYKKLAKEYDLPDFDSLDFEFEIYSLDEEKYLLRAIKDKIVHKIDDYVNILEDTLYPDSASYSSIYETRVLSDEDKDKIMELHKKLMILVRKALYITIDNDEQEIAEFINDVFTQWDEFKPGIKEIAGKLRKAWEVENIESEKIGYLG